MNELASNGTLRSIDFCGCNVNDTAVMVLSNIDVADIFVYDRHMEPESVNWEPLLESKTVTNLWISYGEHHTVKSLKVRGKRK